MHKISVISACLLALAAASPALACSRPMGEAGIESEILAWINAERSKNGLSKLRFDAGLQEAADGHACAMAAEGGLSHDGFAARMQGAGFGAGVENVARSSQTSPQAAARIWRGSSQHWANILDDGIRHVGLGTAVAGDRTYYVFMAAS